MIDHDDLEGFVRSCAALGAVVAGRTQIRDEREARYGFKTLTSRYADQCDTWRGLAAAGEATRVVVENAYRTLETCGDLVASSDVAGDALNFLFDTGLYVRFEAAGADGVRLACAAVRTAAGDYAGAKDLINDRLLAVHPPLAGWTLAVLYWRSARWHDVRQVLAPLLSQAAHDDCLRQAVTVAYGSASAYLGLWDEGFELLRAQGRGPIPAACAEALLTAALCARALDRQQDATALLNEAYTVTDVGEDVRVRITAALSDPGFGIHPTNPARIDARSDYWDPATEPGEREHVRRLGAQRRQQLKAEADKELDGFVGMDEVKEKIKRLESGVKADKRRRELGLPVSNRSLHLVLKGRPGVGKTSIARVVGKLLCAADVLPSEKFIEVGRENLIGEHIGGSEARTVGIVDSIVTEGGGVLFVDEAPMLTSSGSKNDFGPFILAALMRAMLDHADILMVIVAGYPDEMDEFLDSNPGLRSRFGREIELPSYTVDELVKIVQRSAEGAGHVFADTSPLTKVFSQLAEAKVTDTAGEERRALDVAGNGRFANTLLERAAEERDHRLNTAGELDDASEEQAMTITGDDVRAAARGLLWRHKIELDEDVEGGGA